MDDRQTRHALVNLVEAYILGETVQPRPEEDGSPESGHGWTWSLLGLAAAVGAALYTYRVYDRKLGQLVDSLIVDQRRNGRARRPRPAVRRDQAAAESERPTVPH